MDSGGKSVKCDQMASLVIVIQVCFRYEHYLLRTINEEKNQHKELFFTMS